jgi:NADPH-dependent ferric siderophore reductase
VSTRAAQFQATVRRREPLSDHLVRLVLDGLDGPDGFASTGVPDEWVGLVVPGQFQSRYYTVRDFSGGELTLDVVVHDVGLVTEWAMRDCVGDTVTITEPMSSFAPPAAATWLMLAGYLPESPDVTWLSPPSHGQSALAEVVEGVEWPAGEGYFWMAGESAQMRAIRKHLMRVVGLPTSHYDVMGYWRATAGRQPRAVDPGPLWRAGKAAGKSDEQIWAEYDAAREASDG